MGNKIIVVNATALNMGGAKTILTQFLKNITENNHYIVFVDKVDSDFNILSNVKYYEVSCNNWARRIIWDVHGLAAFLKKNKIKPDLIISLQNTSVGCLNNKHQLIYLHQPIPFSPGKWSPFKKSENKLFLYKHFYSFFISIFLKKTDHIVVQTQWMKDAVKRRSWVFPKNVHVIKPSIGMDIKSNTDKRIIKEDYIFYPASAISYKNHQVLAKSI
ncbi:glycosyltransferase, partial [Chromobacterium violaceum]|uniref:glycosyltransferase n=1 Tax=Chromobacterium violaceum TaxID=536 RepID=UPI00111C2AA1